MIIDSSLADMHSQEAVKRFLADQDVAYELRDRCAKPGTWHTVTIEKERRVVPCTGNGICLTKVEVVTDRFTGDEPQVIPRRSMACPCMAANGKEVANNLLRNRLGVIREIDPTLELIGAHDQLHKHQKSLYVQTPGVQDNQIMFYLMKDRGAPEVFRGVQFSEHLRKHALGDKHEWHPLRFFGIMGADKLAASDFVSSRVMLLVELAAQNQTRVVITSKLTPQAFVEKFAESPADQVEMAANLKKWHQVVV